MPTRRGFISRTTGHLDVLWPELHAGVDDHTCGVVWALVVCRAHELAVTRDVVAELTARARSSRQVAVA